MFGAKSMSKAGRALSDLTDGCWAGLVHSPYSKTLSPDLKASDKPFVQPRLEAWPRLLCVLSIIDLKYLVSYWLYIGDFPLRIASFLSPEEGHRCRKHPLNS
jgi:hypothetical protein